ncbi:DUF5753 domain-containing protein [Micromonospora zhanjiangensis]
MLHVRKLLDALDVPRGSDEFIHIEKLAEDAADSRWWDSHTYRAMGGGQRVFALVELGAATIDEYAAGLLPGLVQTEEYARHRIAAGEEADVDVDAIVAGRLGRQRQLAEQGTTYRLVLEEHAVRRYPVPPAVMLDQLRHLLDLADRPQVSIRVLPVAADLGPGPAPRAPYAHISYPDPDDPPIVIIDGVGDPLLDTSESSVSGYARLCERLRRAALSDADSAALIHQVAGALATTI